MGAVTPARQHERRHRHPELLPEDCFQCQREKIKCRGKVRYGDAKVAHDGSIERNIETEWKLMLVPYPCPWCGFYHLTKARPGTARWKRVEKRRRRHAALSAEPKL